MSNLWFNGCINPDMVKKMFRDLAMKHHPDHGGNTRVMQEILEAYESILKSFSGSKFHNQNNTEYQYNFSKKDMIFADKIQEILNLKLANIIIEVVGSWLWVSGTSKEQKDLFNRNGIGLQWSKKQKKWFYNGLLFKGKRKASGLSYDEIKSKYGSQTVYNEDAYAQVN